MFQNALDGHFQVFGIRDGYKRAAVHLRIHFEHGVRGGHAHNATAGKRERFHDLTDTFGRAVDQANVLDIGAQIIGKNLREFQRFGVLRNEFGANAFKNLVDELLRKTAGILVQVKAQVALALVLVENTIQRCQIRIKNVHFYSFRRVVKSFRIVHQSRLRQEQYAQRRKTHSFFTLAAKVGGENARRRTECEIKGAQ